MTAAVSRPVPTTATTFNMTEPLHDQAVHVTRKRTNSLVKRPQQFDPSSPPSSSSTGSSSAVAAAPSPPALGAAPATAKSPNHSHGTRRSSISTSTPSLSASTSSVSTAPTLSASIPAAVDKRHPRDYIPADIGFPKPSFVHRIRKEDADDRLLMATCAIIQEHENRALCPKEIADSMTDRNWLQHAGTTPFTHISTTIRSHLKRAASATPPYMPLLVSYELTTVLAPHEVTAVGLRADDKPAVKRGTLWYLNGEALGPESGLIDPFVRARLAHGLPPLVRPPPVPTPVVSVSAPVLPTQGFEDDDDDMEGDMGRGKRKRKASSAAMAAAGLDATKFRDGEAPLISAAQLAAHRRSYSLSSASNNADTRSTKPTAVAKLKLKLPKVEEDDSDGFVRGAQRRLKKKIRRAHSEGASRSASCESQVVADSSSEDEEEDTSKHVFSSVTSSALLAKTLLAASTRNNPSTTTQPVPHKVVCPGSILKEQDSSLFLPKTSASQLSISAPTMFPSFRLSSVAMAVDEADSSPVAASETVKADDHVDREQAYVEPALQEEDFDFEWGSESYDESTLSSQKRRQRELSIDLRADPLDLHEDDFEVVSTPATSPRSPPAEDEEETPMTTAPVTPGCETEKTKRGLDFTLCEALAKHAESHRAERSNDDSEVPDALAQIEKTLSSQSLASLADEDAPVELSTETPSLQPRPTSIPLPSPLNLELPSTVSAGVIDAQFEFGEHGTAHQGEVAYPAIYEDDLSNSADDEDDSDDDEDEDEDDDLSDMSASITSSRGSSVFRSEAFTTRRPSIVVEDAPSPAMTSSDSEFDASSIVRTAEFVSGRPIPQVAPSPPEISDWTTPIDVDEFDLGLGHESNDLLDPESVGLDELDLAWGEADEAGDEDMMSVDAGSRRDSDRPTFLTTSTLSTPNASSPRRDTNSTRLQALAAQSTLSKDTTAHTSIMKPLTKKASKAALTSSKKKTVPLVHPTKPFAIKIIGTIVQDKVPIYSTPIVDVETKEQVSLLRRIDSDHVNASVLLRGTKTSKDTRRRILRDVNGAVRVKSGGSSIEGIWVPLPVARKIADDHKSLKHLGVFLEDGLGDSFPEPIPTMRGDLRKAMAQAAPSRASIGCPAFLDSEPCSFGSSSSSPSAESAQSQPIKSSPISTRRASVTSTTSRAKTRLSTKLTQPATRSKGAPVVLPEQASPAASLRSSTRRTRKH